MAYVLAVDSGTTGVRAIVFDGGGVAVGSAYRELAMRYPQPGWAEQDPEEAWTATRTVMREAVKQAGIQPRQLAALGIANQRSSITAWDAHSLEPLAPMITWHDVRTAERCAELAAKGFFVTHNMAVSKAEWIVNNVAAAREAAEAGRLRLGGLETWLCARLTAGLHVTDHSNGSATGFYAHMEQSWDRTLLDELGIAIEALPELVDSSSLVGATDPEVLGVAIPIGGICGDQQASLFGLGCRESGQTKCSYGTAAMVDYNSAGSIALGGNATYPLVAWSIKGESTWCVEGSVVTAGAAVQWLRDGPQLLANAAESGALAESVRDSGGVWAVPAFQGIGTPIGQAGARAMVGGISRGTSRAHLVRAFLEGIAHRVTDVAESVWENSVPPTSLRVDGGASRNDFLMQVQADFLGLPIERSPQPDGSALGVATLAAMALATEIGGAGAQQWKPDRVFEPRLDGGERQRLRERWKKRLSLVAQDVA